MLLDSIHLHALKKMLCHWSTEWEFTVLKLNNKVINTKFLKRLSEFSIDHADQDSKFSDVSALSVEQCDCPDGYSGTSCEVSKKVFISKFPFIEQMNFSLLLSTVLLVINDQIVDFILVYVNLKIDNFTYSINKWKQN